MQLSRASYERNALMHGLRGLGIACATGYHDYTPDGVNHVCQPDVLTTQADAFSQVGIQAEAAANPQSKFGQFVNTYGSLPNDVQEQIINCQEALGAQQVIPSTPIPSYCAGLPVPLPSSSALAASVKAASGPMPVAASPAPSQVASVRQPTNTTQFLSPAAGSGAHAMPTTAYIQNLTSGDSSHFTVGDAWRIVITGTPNSPVSSTASQNGATSTSSYGTTDGNGQFSLSGTMGAGAMGNWTEQWSVGGVPAPTLGFTVTAPSPGATGSSSANPFAGGPVNPIADSTSVVAGSNALVPAAPSSCFSLFSGETCYGPVGGETGLAIGAALLVLFMMTRGRR